MDQTFSVDGGMSGWVRDVLVWLFLLFECTLSLGVDWIGTLKLAAANFLSSLLPHNTAYSPTMINTAPMILHVQYEHFTRLTTTKMEPKQVLMIQHFIICVF